MLFDYQNNLLKRRDTLVGNALFDRAWYREHYMRGGEEHDDEFFHYVVEGEAKGSLPNPLFDPLWYRLRYLSRNQAPVSSLLHYHDVGWRQAYSPSPEFDIAWYLRKYRDVRAAAVDPLSHYLRFGRDQDRRTRPLGVLILVGKKGETPAISRVRCLCDALDELDVFSVTRRVPGEIGVDNLRRTDLVMMFFLEDSEIPRSLVSLAREMGRSILSETDSGLDLWDPCASAKPGDGGGSPFFGANDSTDDTVAGEFSRILPIYGYEGIRIRDEVRKSYEYPQTVQTRDLEFHSIYLAQGALHREEGGSARAVIGDKFVCVLPKDLNDGVACLKTLNNMAQEVANPEWVVVGAGVGCLESALMELENCEGIKNIRFFELAETSLEAIEAEVTTAKLLICFDGAACGAEKVSYGVVDAIAAANGIPCLRQAGNSQNWPIDRLSSCWRFNDVEHCANLVRMLISDREPLRQLQAFTAHTARVQFGKDILVEETSSFIENAISRNLNARHQWELGLEGGFVPEIGVGSLADSQRKFSRTGERGVEQLPPIDVSVVTYFSRKHIVRFLESLESQNYPSDLVNLYIRDHSEDEEEFAALQDNVMSVANRFATISCYASKNKGFGAGQNSNIELGRSKFLLICNCDGRLHPQALRRLVESCFESDESVTAWEARQSPFEHPKYYDPVHMYTSWVSGACMLVRREVFDKLGGFDDRIFMYGEDVDWSWRAREAGYKLEYVPRAVFEHCGYNKSGEARALEVAGTFLAMCFLRLRFGERRDVEALSGVYRRFLKNHRELLKQFPEIVESHKNGFRRCAAQFVAESEPKTRGGRFPVSYGEVHRKREIQCDAYSDLKNTKAVSIVIVVSGGRSRLLHGLLKTIVNQTLEVMEVIVVDIFDGCSAGICEHYKGDLKIRTVSLIGETYENAVISGCCLVRGQFVALLEYTGLLFADHIETLFRSLMDGSPRDVVFGENWVLLTTSKGGRTEDQSVVGVNIVNCWWEGRPGWRFGRPTLHGGVFRTSTLRKWLSFRTNDEVSLEEFIWSRIEQQGSMLVVRKTTSMIRRVTGVWRAMLSIMPTEKEGMG